MTVSFLVSRTYADLNSATNVTSAVYFLNVVAYQNYAIGFMLTIYKIRLLLSDVCQLLETGEKHSTGTTNQEMLDDLKDFAVMIDKICDCLERLKIGYTVNTVGFLMHFSFFTILNVYSVLSYFLKANVGIHDMHHCILTTSWEIYYAPFVVWTFVISNLIISEGKRIGIIIRKLCYKSQHKEKFQKRASILLLQLHHRPPLVSCGVFVIDWKLLFQLIGACFSYLVIIIQFEFKGF